MIIAKRVGAGSLGFLAKRTFAYDLRTAEIEVCACVYVCDLEICRNSNFVNYPKCNIRIVLTIFQLWLVTQNKILQNLVLFTGPPRQPRMPRIGPWQVLAATLTLSQPGGADYAHPILGSLAG